MCVWHTLTAAFTLPGGHCRWERAVKLQRGEQRGAAAQEAAARRPGCHMSEVAVQHRRGLLTKMLIGPGCRMRQQSVQHWRGLLTGMLVLRSPGDALCSRRGRQQQQQASARHQFWRPCARCACETAAPGCFRMPEDSKEIAKFDGIVTRRAASHQTPLHRLGAPPQVDSFCGVRQHSKWALCLGFASAAMHPLRAAFDAWGCRLLSDGCRLVKPPSY